MKSKTTTYDAKQYKIIVDFLQMDTEVVKKQWWFKRDKALRAKPAIAALIQKLREDKYVVKFNYGRAGWWFGSISEEDRKITVNMRMPNGKFWEYSDVVFILAHEYRHAEHKRLGLFKEYYKIVRGYHPQLFKIGLAAERDCDRFAKKHIGDVLSDNKSLLKHRRYPAWRVKPTFLPRKVLIDRLMIEFFLDYKDIIGHTDILDKVDPYNQIRMSKRAKVNGRKSR